jgi:16S rRNA (adenine1518-N6/adenine1519-N6)-dimethyltransferase
MSSFDLKARLAEMGIVPKRSLGQNFLVSQHVIGKIVQAVAKHEFKDLVEIGPGLGALTEPLLRAGFKPRLVELDRDLVEYWRGRGLEVVEHDAIKLDWQTLNLRAPALLVSNLPYQISTHLLVERCFGPDSLHNMILMFQKEVAQRLTAKPRSKDYGLLSVMAQLYFRITRVADAAPGDFFPAPKVASRVLEFERLRLQSPLLAQNMGKPFFKFVKGAFAFRRKFLLKNLKSVVNKPVVDRLPAIAEELGLSVKVRAEELSPPQFVRFYEKVMSERN